PHREHSVLTQTGAQGWGVVHPAVLGHPGDGHAQRVPGSVSRRGPEVEDHAEPNGPRIRTPRPDPDPRAAVRGSAGDDPLLGGDDGEGSEFVERGADRGPVDYGEVRGLNAFQWITLPILGLLLLRDGAALLLRRPRFRRDRLLRWLVWAAAFAAIIDP